MSDHQYTSSPTAFERLVRSRWYGAGGIAGLSKVSGVSRATMYAWFRNETVPDTKALARLASVLDVSVAELVEAIGADADVQARSDVPTRALAAPGGPRLGEERIAYRRGTAPAGATIREALPPHQVTVCGADDPIGPVARTLYERHYSQAPVRDGGHWIGLLTTEAIARWMAGRSQNELDVEPRAPVREVLAYADDAGDVRIVPPDMPVGEVVAMFDGAALRGQPLRAVLVASPRAAIAPQGIVTVFDLPELRRHAAQVPERGPINPAFQSRRIPTSNLSQSARTMTTEPDERGQR